MKGWGRARRGGKGEGMGQGGVGGRSGPSRPRAPQNVAGLFPRDNPKNIRFSINYFTAIGLGVLTEEPWPPSERGY